ncbi:MAG: hypothetical protein ACI9SE_000401 [Neolewinella sp.]|jgi:hypothetical protein
MVSDSGLGGSGGCGDSVGQSGTWLVKHPGLQASTTLYLDVADRAGNETRLPLEITVN